MEAGTLNIRSGMTRNELHDGDKYLKVTFGAGLRKIYRAEASSFGHDMLHHWPRLHVHFTLMT